MTLPVAILAGGLAKRLLPLTERRPKALVEVAGRPFIHHQLELLRRRGAERVVLCVGYLEDQIRDYVGDGARWGLVVSYSFDGPRLLGTGGALRKALPHLGSRFLILYGDAYLDCDYTGIAAAFEASGRLGVMTVFCNENRWDRSNVVYDPDARAIVEYDKANATPEMHHIDYGLGGLCAAVFDAYGAEPVLDLAAVYRDLMNKGELLGIEVGQRFYEVGSPAGIKQLEKYLVSGMQEEGQ